MVSGGAGVALPELQTLPKHSGGNPALPRSFGRDHSSWIPGKSRPGDGGWAVAELGGFLLA